MYKKMLDKKENIVKNAEKYALKYLSDLQLHFNLDNQQLIKILKNCTTKLNSKQIKREWWKNFLKIYE